MTQYADNFHFDITAYETGKSNDDLRLCLRLAFMAHSTASHWSVEKGEAQIEGPGDSRWTWGKKPPRLILHWTSGLGEGDEGLTPFLAPIGYEHSVGAVQSWLDSQEYGGEPDHDGDNTKGWRIYVEEWGHVGNRRDAICAVEPAWLMHGK